MASDLSVGALSPIKWHDEPPSATLHLRFFFLPFAVDISVRKYAHDFEVIYTLDSHPFIDSVLTVHRLFRVLPCMTIRIVKGSYPSAYCRYRVGNSTCLS